MSNNNQSLVKHLVESPQLRQWAYKTILAKGGKKDAALASLLQANYLLWERLDQGMEIQQPEAYVRTVMIKMWKQQVTQEQPQAAQMAVASMDNAPSFGATHYESNDETVVLQRTHLKEEKLAKIASWNDVIVQAERRRRRWIIGGILLLCTAVLATVVYFTIIAPNPQTKDFLEQFF